VSILGLGLLFGFLSIATRTAPADDGLKVETGTVELEGDGAFGLALSSGWRRR
jgi:hypothetical protein